MSDLAVAVLDRLRAAGQMIATAESCTGGMIAAALTDVPGCSDVVDRGFVTYSNAAKADMLGVLPELIAREGAVSAAVAAAMAEGALQRSRAAVAVAVTGIAGPGGGSEGKPVGTVWFALARRDAETVTVRRAFEGERAAVRAQTVAAALMLVLL